MHRMSLLILIQLLVLLYPSHAWGMEKHEKRESNTHQDSSSKQKDKQKTSAKSGQVQQEGHFPASSSIEAMFNSIFEIFKQRQEPPLVSRGNLCFLSPGVLGKTNLIWSSKPLFLWQGKVSKLVVRDYDTDEVIWQKSSLAGKEQVAFDGKPLQPGQAYIWEASNAGTTVRYEFRVMNSLDREKVIRNLKDIIRLDSSSFSEESKLAMQIHYLIDEKLYSDALSTLVSHKIKSVELNRTQESFLSSFCEYIHIQ